ncbi:MAG: hypothetical protein WBM13_09225 [Bacteroidia bacterium]
MTKQESETQKELYSQLINSEYSIRGINVTINRIILDEYANNCYEIIIVGKDSNGGFHYAPKNEVKMRIENVKF